MFPVHGVGGIIGTMMAGVFASTQLGLFSGQGFADVNETMGAQLWVQFLGVASTLVYTAVVTWVILKLVNLLLGLRVNPEQENAGLDITQHDERGYDL